MSSMSITEGFTLGDLATLRIQLKLKLVTFFVADDGGRVATIQYSDGFPSVFYGQGFTEAQALNAAVVQGESLRRRVAQVVL